MFFSSNPIAHQEVIQLQASIEQVRAFIMTPERILDYYPGPIGGEVIEQGLSFYCQGKSGVSLLELDQNQSTENTIVLNVTTATNLKPPFTPERIKANTFFTMVEDWALTPTAQGTQLTKTWRDIKKTKLKFLPMGLIVRKSAKAESEKLRKAWDEAAK